MISSSCATESDFCKTNRRKSPLPLKKRKMRVRKSQYRPLKKSRAWYLRMLFLADAEEEREGLRKRGPSRTKKVI